MPTFEIKLPDESPCSGCGKMVPIDINQCPHCGANTYRLTFGAFYADFERFKMMDARYGGLVLGRSDPSDDIPMYICRDGGVYHLVGFMQGGEYIMSRAATMKHRPSLEEINSEKGEIGDIDFPLTSTSSVINTNFMPPYGGLWITETQFVINRYATMKHFTKLDQMNADANYELSERIAEEIQRDATAVIR